MDRQSSRAGPRSLRSPSSHVLLGVISCHSLQVFSRGIRQYFATANGGGERVSVMRDFLVPDSEHLRSACGAPFLVYSRRIPCPGEMAHDGSTISGRPPGADRPQERGDDSGERGGFLPEVLDLPGQPKKLDRAQRGRNPALWPDRFQSGLTPRASFATLLWFGVFPGSR